RRRTAAAAPAANGSQLDFPQIVRRALRGCVRRLRRTFAPSQSGARRESRIQRALGPEYELLQLGRFRRSGEVHQWMYDSYSLSRALVEAGFVAPRRMRANESRVIDWTTFGLDTEPDGRPYKPDSVYVEAVRDGLPTEGDP